MGNGAGDRPAVRVNQLGYLPAGRSAPCGCPTRASRRRSAFATGAARRCAAGARSRGRCAPSRPPAWPCTCSTSRSCGPRATASRSSWTARAAARSARPQALPRARPRRARVLLPAALRRRDRRGPGAGLRAPGGPSRRRERRGVDRPRRRAALPRLVVPGPLRRLRRLVRRGRPRQVRHQRGDARVAAARHGRADPPPRRPKPMVAGDGGAAARGVPLAARLAAAHAGPGGQPARRPGVPPRARDRVGAAAVPAARGSHHARAAPPLDRRRRCTSRLPRRTALACSRTIPPMPGGCSTPRWPPTGPRTPSRCSWPRTMPARSAAGRTRTTTSTTSAPGRPPSSGWPRATRPTRTTRCGGRLRPRRL